MVVAAAVVAARPLEQGEPLQVPPPLTPHLGSRVDNI